MSKVVKVKHVREKERAEESIGATPGLRNRIRKGIHAIINIKVTEMTENLKFA